MDYFTENSNKLKIIANVDVLVVGSGPSGVCAAYAAAKSGANTMIVEQLGDLGGISTSGLMSHWTGSVDSVLYDEIIKRSAAENEGQLKNVPTALINPENLKTLYLEMLTEVGCKIRLYTMFADVICDGDAVKGVIVQSKSGREVILAKVVIDASGDGDVAYQAGAEYILGREEDSKMQPATIMFKVGGVNDAQAIFLPSFESTYDTEKGELQALGKQHISAPAGHVLLYKSTLPGIVTCNMTNCTEIDGTNPEDMTRATIVCRKQIQEIVKFLREFVPGYQNCYCISSASLVGVRESRHFKGMKTLTKADVEMAVYHEDWAVRNARFNFDVHNLSGSGLDKTGCQKHFKQQSGYTIPYGCLVPIKKENLLLCGRNISGTHMAHSSYRAMPICAAMGEAAGYAAYLAVKEQIRVRNVDINQLQKLLAYKDN